MQIFSDAIDAFLQQHIKEFEMLKDSHDKLRKEYVKIRSKLSNEQEVSENNLLASLDEDFGLLSPPDFVSPVLKNYDLLYNSLQNTIKPVFLKHIERFFKNDTRFLTYAGERDVWESELIQQQKAIQELKQLIKKHSAHEIAFSTHGGSKSSAKARPKTKNRVKRI